MWIQTVSFYPLGQLLSEECPEFSHYDYGFRDLSLCVYILQLPHAVRKIHRLTCGRILFIRMFALSSVLPDTDVIILLSV